MKTTSLRVPPEIAPHLIRFINNNDVKATWDKVDYDTHTLFTAKRSEMNMILAFIDGFKYAREITL